MPQWAIMPTGLLFSGQGAQKVGMGKSLYENHPYARQLYDTANDVLGYDFAQICFEGPQDELTKTNVCQPALYVHGLACLELWKQTHADDPPVAALGLSLGELTALAAAGVYDFKVGLQIVAERGRLMQVACDQTNTDAPDQCDTNDHNTDKQRKPRAIDQTRQHITPDCIRAQQELPLTALLPHRWHQQGIAVLLCRQVRRKQRRKYRQNSQRHDDEQANHGTAVFREVEPEFGKHAFAHLAFDLSRRQGLFGSRGSICHVCLTGAGYAD